jgi:hypothetical protein
MKKIISKIASAVMAAGLLLGSAFSVYAEDVSDVELDTSEAVSIGSWGTSVKYQYDAFDTTRMTKDSKILVEFSVDGDTEINSAPIELVFQSWEYPDTDKAAADGTVWAKVSADTYDDHSAEFKYTDIVASYGSNNFEKVSCICFTATDAAKITVTKVTVTNCIETGSHYVDEEAAKEEAKEATKNNMTFTIIGIVAGIVLAVVIVVLIMNKKSSSAYDVSSGEFVSKKDTKDAKDAKKE